MAWLIRNNRLLKASAEQLRFASEREHVLHQFDKPGHVPWTMSELTAPLGREEYDDTTHETPTEAERDEFGGQPQWAPPSKRVRTKAAGSPATPREEATTRSRSPMKKRAVTSRQEIRPMTSGPAPSIEAILLSRQKRFVTTGSGVTRRPRWPLRCPFLLVSMDGSWLPGTSLLT